MSKALDLHNDVLNQAIAAHGGKVFKVVGDQFQAVFEDSMQAVMAAIAAQRMLATTEWGRIGPLQVRMGLHTGHAVWEGGLRRQPYV